METNKNLDELLAAIGDGSANAANSAARVKQAPAQTRNPTAAFPPAPQIPIPSAPQAMSRPLSSTMNTAPSRPNVNGHYNDLLSLLQRQGTPAANQQLPRSQNPPAARMPASARLSFVPGGRPTPSQALDPKALAALKRQHEIQAAQAKQRRESLTNVSTINRNPPAVPVTRMNSQGFPTGIPPGVNVPTMGTSTNQESQLNPNVSAQQRPNSAAQQGQPRSITQEQVIVGHFCRHAIKTLKKIVEGLPYAAQVELRLREHIKAVWSQWVKGMITRPQLLQSVSNFVKQSTPNAKDVDVIRDFKAWYEHEYELQKQRNRQPQPPKQVRHPQAPGQDVRHVNNVPAHPGSQAVRTNLPPQSVSAARGQLKQEPQRPTIVHTAGKTIGTKPEPTIAAPGRAMIPKNAGGRAMSGENAGGKGKSPAAYQFQAGVHAGIHPGGNVQINYAHHQLQPQISAKRSLDSNISSPPNAVKKAKTASKVPKAATSKKKPSLPVGIPLALKGTRPPIQKPDQRNKGAKRPMASGALPPPGPVPISVGNPSAEIMQKKARRQEDLKEINLVDNVVDIEDEEVKLNVDANGKRQSVDEVVRYNPDMIVSGPILRMKMQSIAKSHGIHENISNEATELMSLAVRERLACILESLKTIASVRVGAEKEQWGRVETGLDIREKLQRAREDEERTLQVAAEMRVKRRKEQKEAEAKRFAGEAAKNDKSAKDSSAAAEAERKEKLALEKKKKESSSQRDALSGLVRDFDRRRRRASAKPLAPLKPLGKPGLPPLAKRPSSDSLGRSGLKPLGSLDKLKMGPLVKLGGRSNSPIPRGLGRDPVAPQVRLRVTLMDCLFLFESERNTKKSCLLYKWYARLPCGK
ncbi:unnamed protein product [Agarophyton chilense]